MNQLYYLIGNSVQDVRVPLVVFLSAENLNAFITTHGLSSSEGLPDYLDRVVVNGTERELDEVLESPGSEGQTLRNALFLHGEYSPVEGGIYSLTVVVAEPGVPVVGFSLE